MTEQSKVRVGYFTHSQVGVSETFIYDLIQGLDKVCDLTFFSGADTLPHRIVDKQVATGYAADAKRGPYLRFKLGQLLGTGRGYELKGKAFEGIAYSKLKGIKDLDNVDVAYVDYGTSAVVLMRALQERGIPMVVHVHGYDITSATADPFYLAQLRKLFDVASHFICASDYMRRLLVLLGCEGNKISMIRYGLDGKAIEPMTWASRLESVPKVIFLGRLTLKKHPIALLHAFEIVKQRVPDAELTIIGDGPLKGEVQDRIKALGLTSSVKMLGAKSREEAFPIMNEHWVYAQHSVTALNGDQEGYAISPAEAALMEIPVVSTYHNGIPEHVIDGQTGFLVKEYDYPAMAERIIQLLQDPKMAEQMGMAGRENILQMNEPTQRITKVNEILTQVARKS